MAEPCIAPKDLFHIVTDWLKFAEAKNAALIAACGIFVPVLIKLVADHGVIGKLYGWSGLVFLAMAAFLSIISFLSRLTVFEERLWRPAAKVSPTSSIYFGEIASMTQEGFLENYAKLFGKNPPSELDRQLAIQNHINARIAFRKFRYFSSACWCFLAAIFTPVVLLVLLILSKNDDI